MTQYVFLLITEMTVYDRSLSPEINQSSQVRKKEVLNSSLNGDATPIFQSQMVEDHGIVVPVNSAIYDIIPSQTITVQDQPANSDYDVIPKTPLMHDAISIDYHSTPTLPIHLDQSEVSAFLTNNVIPSQTITVQNQPANSDYDVIPITPLMHDAISIDDHSTPTLPIHLDQSEVSAFLTNDDSSFQSPSQTYCGFNIPSSNPDGIYIMSPINLNSLLPSSLNRDIDQFAVAFQSPIYDDLPPFHQPEVDITSSTLESVDRRSSKMTRKFRNESTDDSSSTDSSDEIDMEDLKDLGSTASPISRVENQSIPGN